MKPVHKIVIILIVLLVVALLIFFLLRKPTIEGQVVNKPSQDRSLNATIRIANWNLQIFGQSKASKPDLMAKYVGEIGKYDIVFVQEIRDSSGIAFEELCSLLPEYDCKVSSRAGQTSSKEQYGVMYRKGLQLLSMTDFNQKYQADFQRPPLLVVFNLTLSDLSVYNIHIDPDKVASELKALESVVNSSGNVIILGDLNADCSYYNPSASPEFDSWFWIIKDNEDTTVASTNCAYDRIILNMQAKDQFIGYGIDKNVTSDMSDHYLVWAEMRGS